MIKSLIHSSNFTCVVCDYLSMLGLKLNHASFCGDMKIMELCNFNNDYKWWHKLWLDAFWPIINRIGFAVAVSEIVRWEQQDNVRVKITIDWLSNRHSKYTLDPLWTLSVQTVGDTYKVHYMNHDISHSHECQSYPYDTPNSKGQKKRQNWLKYFLCWFEINTMCANARSTWWII